MSQFSFPVLENEELLTCLQEMEVSMDASQLAKPSYDCIRPIFEQIVILLTGISREEMTQPVFTFMDVFEYPELHDESISTNNFFRQLCKLMAACGVKDFSWRDVFKPEPVRLKRHLSAIVNFAKFREEKALNFQDLQAKLDSLVEATTQLEEEQARHAAELRRLQAARAEQAAEVQGVEAEEAALTQRNTALNKQAAALQAEVRQLKSQAGTLTDAASQAKLDLASARQETDVLQDQIVQSPDKHRQAIAELGAAAEAKRTYCAQLSSQSIDKDRQLEMVGKFDKELARCLKLLEELEGVIGKKKDASQAVKDLREAIATDERALGEVTNTNATLKRHQATVMDKFQRLEAQAALKMEAAASFVEEAMKSKEAVEANNAAAAARAAEDEAVMRSVLERIQETTAMHDATVRGVLDKYAMLHAAVLDYNARLEAALAAGQQPPAM